MKIIRQSMVWWVRWGIKKLKLNQHRKVNQEGKPFFFVSVAFFSQATIWQFPGFPFCFFLGYCKPVFLICFWLCIFFSSYYIIVILFIIHQDNQLSYNTVILLNTFQRDQPTVATTRESNKHWSYKKERKHYIQQPHDVYYYYCRDDGELKNTSTGFWIKKKSKNLNKLFDWTYRHIKRDTHS